MSIRWWQMPQPTQVHLRSDASNENAVHVHIVHTPRDAKAQDPEIESMSPGSPSRLGMQTTFGNGPHVASDALRHLMFMLRKAYRWPTWASGSLALAA